MNARQRRKQRRAKLRNWRVVLLGTWGAKTMTVDEARGDRWWESQGKPFTVDDVHEAWKALKSTEGYIPWLGYP